MVDNEVTITVGMNGPYIVKGQIKLVDADGAEFQVKGSQVALCRCGLSSNKPFCDGTHAREGFDAPTKVN